MALLVKALVAKEIRYKWTFPFGLMFTWEGKQRRETTWEEGLNIMGIQEGEAELEEPKRRGEQTRQPRGWEMVKQRRSNAGREGRKKLS